MLFSKLRYLLFFGILQLAFISGAGAEFGQTHRIGVILGLTGAANIWSENARLAIELARDEINESGGINGKPIELIIEDSGTDAASSVAAYKKLVQIDKVKIIVGDIWAHLTGALVPLAQKDRVILLTPTDPEVSEVQAGKYFFSMGHKAGSVREAVNKFFQINKKARKVGIFCFDNTWGESYLKVWREAAAANGVEIVEEICSARFDEDHRASITKMRSKKVDGIIAAEWTDQILKIMKEQQYDVPVLGTSNVIEAVTIRNRDNDLMEGVYFTYWQPSRKFLDAFESKYGKPPILEADNSYEILRSVAKALKESEEDVVSALRNVHYEGVGGAIDFRNGFTVNKGIGHLYQVRNREIVLAE